MCSRSRTAVDQVAELLADDRELEAGRVQVGERLAGAGQDLREAGHYFVGTGAVEADVLGDFSFGHRREHAGDDFLQRGADSAADRFRRGRWDAHLLGGVAMAGNEAGAGVYEREVEVEDDGGGGDEAATGHESTLPASAAL